MDIDLIQIVQQMNDMTHLTDLLTQSKMLK